MFLEVFGVLVGEVLVEADESSHPRSRSRHFVSLLVSV